MTRPEDVFIGEAREQVQEQEEVKSAKSADMPNMP